MRWSAAASDLHLLRSEVETVQIKPANMEPFEANHKSFAPQAERQQRVVMLVEDEALVREITAQVLIRAGYKVLQSSGSKDALYAVAAYDGKIDLLLTDVVMPGMNGVELAERILELQPALVTVFMSGYADCDVLRKVLRQATHIQKPFTVNSLLSRVAEALNRGAEETPARGSVLRL